MKVIRELNPQADYEPEALRGFFIEHLDRIYCAKSHLVERLPELIEQAAFSDLRFAIAETLKDVEMQMARMDAIYQLLNAEKTIQQFNGLIGLVEDAFTSIVYDSANAALRDMGILFYLNNVENVEMASFKVLLLISVRLPNKDIKHLLKENFEEAKADNALLILILTKYVIN